MATKQRALPLGTLIDSLWAERETKREQEASIKEVEARIEALTLQVMERMEAEGLDKMSGTKASLSIGATVTANVTDWDAFSAYIIKNKYTHLLQRRVSDPAYRELLESGKKVAGTEPFIKKRLNMRSISN